MINYFDSYVRLNIFVGELIDVVYYVNGIKKQFHGYLDTIVGADYIVCCNDNEKVKIPFFDEKCIIKSIRLSNKDVCCDDLDDILYFNEYDFSESFSETIKKQIFGSDIIYSSVIDRSKSNPYFRFPYKTIFYSREQRIEFFEFLRAIVVELTDCCKKNNLNPELSFVGIGATSVVLAIGDKIVKFGTKRRQEVLPYCEYLLQPLINENFKFGDRDIHLEVTQKVKKGTKMAADYLNTQLSLIGLRSYDIDSFNVGFLNSKKDNCINYKDNIFYNVASDRATSIVANSDLHLNTSFSDKIFDGQFPVILDLDDLYIYDIDKYAEYLLIIGINEDIVRKVINDYYVENTKKDRFLS